jgi:hypothetical protein
MTLSLKFSYVIGWVFGILVFINGLINLFRGNDPLLGVAFMLISLVFLPPVNAITKRRFGISVHRWIKILLALVIIWITLAVGAVAEGYLF